MKDQSGFSITGIALVVVATAVIGIIGWRVWEQNKKQANTADSQSQTDTTDYLEIKELGVRIRLGEGIKDAFYYYDSTARISTKTIVDKSGGTCDPKTSAPFGTLTGAEGAAGTKVFESGSTSITLDMSTGLCSDDPEVQSLIQNQFQQFREALKTMEPSR